jgi:elongation factor P--(R)-beta-lysine ligase
VLEANTVWSPTATRETLVKRAELLAEVRRFFATRNVLEVETPILSLAATTDLNIHSFTGMLDVPGLAGSFYLQTSPEFAMKRLLAAGSGPIYQIARVFRAGERGRWHNSEFTLLEWYRPGYDHLALMDELDELLHTAVRFGPSRRTSYQTAFLDHAELDPLAASSEELQAVATRLGMREAKEQARDVLLDFILSVAVAPHLGVDGPEYLYEYPASQAALARLSPRDPRVAERFELYLHGVELANGFHELTDPDEQAERFAADRRRRADLGLPDRPTDERLLAALRHGLPACAGVAVGIDRLLLCTLGLRHIDEVLTFPVERA